MHVNRLAHQHNGFRLTNLPPLPFHIIKFALACQLMLSIRPICVCVRVVCLHPEQSNAHSSHCKSTPYPFFNNLLTVNEPFLYICAGVSLLRPAPLELPQGGNAARVESCSGAIKVAYPFFIFPSPALFTGTSFFKKSSYIRC